jgi:hypothetical protein
MASSNDGYYTSAAAFIEERDNKISVDFPGNITIKDALTRIQTWDAQQPRKQHFIAADQQRLCAIKYPTIHST